MSEKFAPRLRQAIKHAAFWFLWPAIAIVVWGELTPHPPPVISELLGWDKAQHFIAYFGLALLGTLGWARRLAPVVIFLATLVLGGTLELLQALVGRDAEWGDMLANTLGASAGTGLALLLLWAARLVDRWRLD